MCRHAGQRLGTVHCAGGLWLSLTPSWVNCRGAKCKVTLGLWHLQGDCPAISCGCGSRCKGGGMSAIWANTGWGEGSSGLSLLSKEGLSLWAPSDQVWGLSILGWIQQKCLTQPVAHSLHGESGWQLPGAFALNWEGWISEWYRVFNLKTFQNFSMTFYLAVHFHS